MGVQALFLLFAGDFRTGAFLVVEVLLGAEAGQALVNVEDGDHDFHRQAAGPFDDPFGGRADGCVFHIQRQADDHALNMLFGDDVGDGRDGLKRVGDFQDIQRRGELAAFIADGQANTPGAQIDCESSHTLKSLARSSGRSNEEAGAQNAYNANMDIVVAITGASGAIYAQRMLHALAQAKVRVHLVVSPLGRRLLHDELGMEQVNLPALAGTEQHAITLYQYKDVGARLASGTFVHQGMVVIPCSSNTLSQVACGLGDNLIARAAAVALKERRRLVLVHREMPLSPIDVNNYKTLTDAGAIIAPANPGWYLNPTSLTELADFVAGKTLDLLGVEHSLYSRWDPVPGAGPGGAGQGE